jgi:hypothetical protein
LASPAATAISLDEYRDAKRQLVHAKQELKDKIAASEANRGGWFEPAIRFVNAAKQAGFLAENGNDVSRRDFLKKHGSILTVSNRTLTLVARQPWQLVVDQGLLAQRNTAPSSDGAALVGENHLNINSAESVG